MLVAVLVAYRLRVLAVRMVIHIGDNRDALRAFVAGGHAGTQQVDVAISVGGRH